MTAVRILQLTLGGAGVALLGYGVYGLFNEQVIKDRAAVGEWLLAGVMGHDFLLAPVVYVLCAIAFRLTSARWRGRLAALLLIGGSLFLISIPALVRQGLNRNTTVLPLDYARNLSVLLTVLVAAMALYSGVDAVRRRAAANKAGTEEDEPGAEGEDEDEADEEEDEELMISTAREPAADVLVVDDDPTVAEVVTAYLRRNGHTVRLVSDGPSAVAAAQARLPDLVVLDLMLPGYDGFEVFRRVRQLGPVCVIMLTARTSEQDRILGLELGADDYVTKPFSPRELALRVRSVLRRTDRAPQRPAETAADVLRHGPLEVDLTRHEARCDGQLLNLTVREYDLLAFLLAHPRQVFTRAELMREVWGWEFGDQSTVTVHVRRLREKVEPDPAVPRYLVTVWGVGYRLDDPEEAAAEPAEEPAESEQQPGESA